MPALAAATAAAALPLLFSLERCLFGCNTLSSTQSESVWVAYNSSSFSLNNFFPISFFSVGSSALTLLYARGEKATTRAEPS